MLTNHVINSFIYMAQTHQTKLNLLRLHQLCYLAYVKCLKEKGIPLFPDRFKPTSTGPTLERLEYHFGKNQNPNITTFIKDGNGEYFKVKQNTPVDEILNNIWVQTNHMSDLQITKICTQKPYKIAYKEHRYIEDQDILY